MIIDIDTRQNVIRVNNKEWDPTDHPRKEDGEFTKKGTGTTGISGDGFDDDKEPEYTSETIEIDGKERTVYNSNGERLAKSEQGLRNFYKWFGDSKVVDEQGRPLVVYHGSLWHFDEFKNKNGVFDFSANKKFAERYASDKSFENGLDLEPVVYSVYLKANNIFDFRNTNDLQKLRTEIQDKEVKFGFGGADLDAIIEGIRGVYSISAIEDQEFNNAKVGDFYSKENNDITTYEDSLHDNEIVYKNDDYFVAMSYLQKLDRSAKINKDAAKAEIINRLSDFDFGEDLVNKITITVPTENGGTTEVSSFLRKVEKESTAQKADIYDNWEFLEQTLVDGKNLDEFIKGLGYDGYYLRESDTINIAVFDPTQIKSVNNRGTYSSDTANINNCYRKGNNMKRVTTINIDTKSRTIHVNNEWDESKHKRDDGGKFTSGGKNDKK